jgi:DNA polymerase-3 subunit delta
MARAGARGHRIDVGTPKYVAACHPERVSVFLVQGDDESLVHSGVSDVVHRLVGSNDRSLMVDEFDSAEYQLSEAVDAAQTPAFLTERRVVIARDIGRFAADEVACLVQYLDNPLDSTDLVLVGGGGRIPKALADALKRSNATVLDVSPPTRARERGDWFQEHVKASGLRLDAPAVAMLTGWLGEDAGRLQGILDTLRSTYGDERVLRSADIEPFLGEAGGVPPWDLTDAIDKGDAARSLQLLHRMMRAGERHPLQVMSVLHSHYTKLLCLDGADARDEVSAAAAIGIKPGFPAKKALDQYRRLGSSGTRRAIELLAQADLDLRGAKEWPEELVMEVLVARLSRLVPGRR